MIKALGLTAITVFSAGLAMADSGRIETTTTDPLDGFYFGGDIGYEKINYDDSTLNSSAEDKLPLLNVYAGYDFTDHFAVEGGMFITDSKTKGSTKAEEYGMFVDAVGKYNVYKSIDLLGTAGVQYSRGKFDNGTTKTSETEFAPRLGLGAQAAITDNMNVRGMVRYTKIDYDDQLNDTLSYTIGLNYKF